ncbi:hypothetical protein I9X38_02315 [Bacillus mojavensis]|nr:hypothetical protein I9X38_02315 [Bacillus mojavensis]
MTAPSGRSQSNLIKEVYERFYINPRDMEYIVTHGTGTQLGDPIAINALADAFKDYTEERPLIPKELTAASVCCASLSVQCRFSRLMKNGVFSRWI